MHAGVFALVTATLLEAGAPPAPLRVLFIGNSYTYFNNAPEIFAELSRAALPERQVETRMVAVPGETLLALWERSEARQALVSSRWDYVVIQDQSLLGEGLRDGKFVVNSPSLLHWGVRLFDGEIRATGARTVVLQTWARRTEAGHQPDLDYAYDSVAREIKAILAPVGRVWERVRKDDPEVNLYSSDGSHPSSVGSYVLACTLLSVLFPDVDRNLPTSVSGHAVSRGGVVDTSANTVLVSLPAAQAKQLQSVSKSVVEELQRQGGYLNAPRPERIPAVVPSGQPLRSDRLAGAWTGELTYYPSRAVLDVSFRFEGEKCQGDVVIQVPERKQRYDTPLAECSVSAETFTFSVVTLPLPFLTDRFTGRLVEERLVGTVERTGRELTNSMSGTWSLRRGDSSTSR
jgi:hypothetical protein